MIRRIRNFAAYFWYVCTRDWFQLASTIIDVLILIWSFVNWKEIALQPSFLLLFFCVFINIIWQFFNVASHFKFIRREKPSRPLASMLGEGNGKCTIDSVRLADNLNDGPFPYVSNSELGILENPSIDALLTGNDKRIALSVSNSKSKRIKAYVKEYEATLLKFLNKKWHDVKQYDGLFVNERKACLAQELSDMDGEGHLCWRICNATYYDGCLTNFLYTQYVDGDYYLLYPPYNIQNEPIRRFEESHFSDHIGVSTLLYTKDKQVIIFRQSRGSVISGGSLMPSGSGSLNYSDFHKNDDLKDMIVRGAERELKEESSIKKLLKQAKIETKVIKFCRDIQRGGKPEFFCITFIDKTMAYIIDFIHENKKELVEDSRKTVLFDKEESWAEILSHSSFALKMNYLAAKTWLSTHPERPFGEV